MSYSLICIAVATWVLLEPKNRASKADKLWMKLMLSQATRNIEGVNSTFVKRTCRYIYVHCEQMLSRNHLCCILMCF